MVLSDFRFVKEEKNRWLSLRSKTGSWLLKRTLTQQQTATLLRPLFRLCVGIDSSQKVKKDAIKYIYFRLLSNTIDIHYVIFYLVKRI